jgi:hypothetical protein
VVRSATDLWLPGDGWTATYVSMIPWFVCHDETGRWCVERHGAWSCRITLTDIETASDADMEAHAHDLARVLNRIYGAG